MTPSRQRRTPPATRGDIQALRALAVGSVVVYHLWPRLLRGGYVGVDVFFVISGYLIAGQLLGELADTGRVRLGRFWARRAKRLVPASSLVLLATTAGVLAVVPRALWRQFLSEVFFSTAQLQNWRLAHDAVDYLGADNARSPVQHFWSLSVEEQCYVGLPLLLVLCVLAGRARVRAATGALALLSVASLAWSVHQTRTAPGYAYFSTAARAWELGAGALLACWVVRRQRRPPRRRREGSPAPTGAVAWCGVAAVLLACVAFSGTTAFPGVAALLPVVGTTVALLAGEGTALDRLGRWAPVAHLGRISYSVYLWHWPLIVLLPYATGHGLTSLDRLGILAAATAIASASTRWLEEPVRFRPGLLGARSPRFVALSCGTTVSLVALVAACGVTGEAHREDGLQRTTASIVASHPRCLGAQAVDPARGLCVNDDLDGMLVPDPDIAASDDANEADCWGTTDGTPDVCTVGPATGYTRKLLAVGDSHNNALIGVYRTLATDLGWRIDVAGLGGCFLTDATLHHPTQAQDDECLSWRRGVVDRANHGGYDAILVTHARSRSHGGQTGSPTIDPRATGLASAWARLPDVPVVAIGDNPVLPRSTTLCVGAHRDQPNRYCSTSERQALRYPDEQQQAVGLDPRARYVDLTRYYCPAGRCLAVIGHVLVYRDGRHLTATYAATLAPYVERDVLAALRES